MVHVVNPTYVLCFHACNSLHDFKKTNMKTMVRNYSYYTSGKYTHIVEKKKCRTHKGFIKWVKMHSLSKFPEVEY